jgi:AraC-like DNA-binding protein
MSKSGLPEGQRHWSTDGVDPQQALAWWIDTVCDRFLALDIDAPEGRPFRASLDQVDMGAATANFISAASQRVRRTPAKIARSGHETLILLQLRAGRMQLAQAGREVVVESGQTVLIDAARPYALACPMPTSALALHVPEAWLTRWLAHPAQHALRLFGAGGWNQALNAALASLDPSACETLALPKGAVAEQLAALLSLAIGRDSTFTQDYRLVDALRRTLRERLHEIDLDPAAVAAQHQLSTRRLHYAFAAEQTTFANSLMALRLDRARELLSAPRLATVPVAEIAARCGFADASHFARRFRQAAGASPLAFRAAALGRKH